MLNDAVCLKDKLIRPKFLEKKLLNFNLCNKLMIFYHDVCLHHHS